MQDSILIRWTLLFWIALPAGGVLALEQAPPVAGGAWDIGPGLIAMITSIATAILATITLIANGYFASRARREDRAELAEVKKTGEEAKATVDTTKETVDTTHQIVNSQRTMMEEKITALEKRLEESIRTITFQRAVADVPQKPKKSKKE